MRPGLISTHDKPPVVTVHELVRREPLPFRGTKLYFRCRSCASDRLYGVEAA